MPGVLAIKGKDGAAGFGEAVLPLTTAWQLAQFFSA